MRLQACRFQACRFQAFCFTPNCFQPLGLATRRLCALGLRPFHCEPLLRLAIVPPASGVGPVRLRRLDRLDLRLVLVELGRHELERAGTNIGRLGSGERVDERGQGVVTVIRGDSARQRDERAAKAQGIPGLPRLVDWLPALARRATPRGRPEHETASGVEFGAPLLRERKAGERTMSSRSSPQSTTATHEQET